MAMRLFTPMALGGLFIENRVVMAPMTRSRAVDGVPTRLMEEYYRQRAGAGLIVTEGTSPAPDGSGYSRIPGLFTDEQVQGWRRVTEGVHAAGGRIFVQLMHTGRIGHPANMAAGSRILGPSPIAAPGLIWTDTLGPQPPPVPAEMSGADIAHAIASYAKAAARAIEAGFDGVELHAANGYLIDQFLNTASNVRTDRWGGDARIANRLRFAVDVAQACAEATAAERIGVLISPYGVFNGMAPDEDMDALYEGLVTGLNAIGVAYIHVADGSSTGTPAVGLALKAKLRAAFTGNYTDS